MKETLNFSEKRDVWILFLVLLATGLMYSISINGPFTYDDIDQTINNPFVHHLLNFKDIFLKSPRNTRPLLNLFYTLAWSVAPGKTWPFHFGLIVVHLINTALVFRLIRKIFPKYQAGRSILVWVTTILFAIHPLQVQGVSYITGGTSAIQCFFYLACLNLYDSVTSKNDWKVRVLLGISMLCKESCVLIPVVLIWWDLTIGRFSFKSLPYRRHGLFILSSLLVMIPMYRFVANPTTLYSGSTGFDLFPYKNYFLTQGYYYLFYIRLLLDSSMQSLIHPYTGYEDRSSIFGLVGWALCAAFVYFALSLRRKRPIFSFFVGFFFLSLVLTNTFLQMVNPFAEYRLYQPNLALFVAIAFLASKLLSVIEKPALKTVAFVGPLIWLLWSCVLMQTVWSNEVAIYIYSLSVYPESFELTQILGGYYEDQKRFDLAEEQYLKAVPLVKKTLAPIGYHPYRLLFRIYVFSKQWDKALNEIEIIERELNGGKLPDDGYAVWLKILRKKNDRVRYEEIRKKALGFYPSFDYPKWIDEVKDVNGTSAQGK